MCGEEYRGLVFTREAIDILADGSGCYGVQPGAGLIQKGRLLAVGKPEELRSRDESTRVEVFGRGFTPELLAALRARSEILSLREEKDRLLFELRPGAGMDQVIATMIACGAQLEEVRKEKASLEDIFLDLVNEEKEGGKL